MTGVDFLKWVAAWLGLGSAIYVLFDRAEKVVKPEVREAISQWLQNRGHGEAAKNWPEAFAKVFDQVFGEKHLSGKCFLRSSAASTAAAIVASLVIFAVHPALIEPRFEQGLMKGLWETAQLGFLFVGLNTLPDYVSLLETRWVLARMRRTPAPVPTLLLLMLDLLLTTLLIIAFLVVLTIFVNIAFGRDWMRLYWIRKVLSSPLDLAKAYFVFWRPFSGTPLAPLAYSTYLTSVWIWLYLLGGLALKTTHLLGLGVRWVGKVFDIKEQPLRSIGLVCNLGITVAFLILLITSLLFPSAPTESLRLLP